MDRFGSQHFISSTLGRNHAVLNQKGTCFLFGSTVSSEECIESAGQIPEYGIFIHTEAGFIGTRHQEAFKYIPHGLVMFAALRHIRKLHLGGIHSAEWVENHVIQITGGLHGCSSAGGKTVAVLHHGGIRLSKGTYTIRRQSFQLFHILKPQIFGLFGENRGDFRDRTGELTLRHSIRGVAGENIAVQCFLVQRELFQKFRQRLIHFKGLCNVGVAV